ncbi:E3 ubiquitin-protein ligase TRIM7-like isoform X2 [Rhineura floridana]|uniref:E3 ubiquitin-protein ligase TRIM7-like isoform X2 n=1 Tax=Rhineura floridana TaxID=261503 RepID=UPI002AC8540C|nr:E3 ubiquitin-protein ligase TRIM7-like isoform X2 [Rhineura floridana]
MENGALQCNPIACFLRNWWCPAPSTPFAAVSERAIPWKTFCRGLLQLWWRRKVKFNFKKIIILVSSAMAAESTLKKFELEVTCSICLEYFTDPVILDCGHNFCHHCVFSYWRNFVPDKSCPQCKWVAEPDRLLTNKPLENFVGLLKQLEVQAKEAMGEDGVCERHSEPLALFCKTDQALICSACVESMEHQAHDMVPVEQAAQETKDHFVNCIEILRNQGETILGHKSKADKESYNLLKSANTLSQETVTKFKELRQFLMSEEHRVISKIQDTVKEFIKRRNNHMGRLFREVSSCESVIREMEKKRCQSVSELLQDVGSTLDRFQQVTSFQCTGSFSTKQLWEIWDISDANTSLDSAVKQFKDMLERKSALQEAIITFDPETAHPCLILSEDCKSVRLGDRTQDVPKNRKRFESSVFLLGCEEFAVGRNYWDVAVGSEGEWAVGVARKSVKRKEVAAISFKVGIWAVGKRGSQYVVFNPPDFSHLNFTGELKKIRVSLNCTGRQVTFFDADEAVLLFQTPIMTIARETFLPFFHVADKAVLTLPH